VGAAALFAVLALLMVRALGADALHSPTASAGELRALVQRSSVLGALNDALPPSGPLLRVLREVSPTPVVRGPDPDVPPPDPTLADDPEIDAAARSVVRVTGVACGLGVAGSGWVARPGIVVTNAHVVAGQEETLVTSADGVESEAQVVFYEPRDDLAVLAGGDLDVPALGLDSAPLKGEGGAVAGYPENGPLTVVPARLGTTGVVASQDSYGRGPIRRRMTAFRADVRSGTSGGPVLDGRGRVMATVFAASAEQGPPSGLGVPNELVAAALEGPLEPVEPGPCAA
ncbi:MAG: trypsin-like peptidase domain-containing protein, partial [Solirubrobacterales bacterium]|nr:trypsin-like peptidase domain-containing protein [Solirubrobacterales bacterium]